MIFEKSPDSILCGLHCFPMFPHLSRQPIYYQLNLDHASFVQFLPVGGTVEFMVDPPEEMREMLWMVPTVPWHTISNSAELNGFTVTEVRSHSSIATITINQSMFILCTINQAIQF